MARPNRLWSWKASSFVVLVAVVASLESASAQTVDAPQSVSGWTLTGELNVPRHGHTATLLQNGKVLVVGGDEAGTAELYDPVNGTWSFTGSLAFLPSGALTAQRLPDGSVLLVGGGVSDRYDPGSGTWSFAGRVIGESSNATPLPDGRVLVAGGWGSADGSDSEDGDVVKAVSVYDPATNTWSGTESLNVPRYWSSATRLLDGRVLVARGSDQGDLLYSLSSAEIYDPVAGTWTLAGADETPPFEVPAALATDSSFESGGTGAPTVFHTATLLNDGKVLFAGGYASGGLGGCCTLAASMLFDPATLTSTRIGDLAIPRYEHTATLLRNGDVLVVGGQATTSYWPAVQYRNIDSVERLAAGSTTWTVAPTLNVARSGHTATLLADGRVLVVGGRILDTGPPFAATPLRSAEIYDPGESSTKPCDDDKNHYILSCLLSP